MEFFMFETFFLDMRKNRGRLDLEESLLKARRV